MNTSKTLPWLASTAGIKLDRANQLWNSASDSARRVTGESQSARYLSLAHDRLVSLVEREVLAANPVEDTPWLMIQAHLSVIPVIALNSISHALGKVRSSLCKSIGIPTKCH